MRSGMQAPQAGHSARQTQTAALPHVVLAGQSSSFQQQAESPVQAGPAGSATHDPGSP
jgi:hypothetical protein